MNPLRQVLPALVLPDLVMSDPTPEQRQEANLHREYMDADMEMPSQLSQPAASQFAQLNQLPFSQEAVMMP